MNTFLKTVLPVLLLILGILAAGTYFFLKRPPFGGVPAGAALEKCQASPHYADGQFHNLIDTPQLTEGVTMSSMMVDYFFSFPPRLRPSSPLPAVRTDLTALPEQDGIVWFGHSSFLLQLNGKKILVDPVFSDYAAPVFFSTRAFDTAVSYTPEDMPDIDYLVISHDHWDHLDYRSVTALQSRIGKVVCGLGVGSHFLRWGFAPGQIIEGDWFEKLEAEAGLTIHFVPARHFSGRGLKRDGTLWTAFVLETPERKIFYSGDSGYGPHFADIGNRFGGFDVAIMQNGQYDIQWKYIHMTPEEAMRATTDDLKAAALLPVHAGRFSIARHAWDDPFRRIASAAEGQDIRLMTPKMGEWVDLTDPRQTFSRWWEGID